MNIFDVTAFMAPPDYNPLCLCGHSQSKHFFCLHGVVPCQVKKCGCWRFRLPEEDTK